MASSATTSNKKGLPPLPDPLPTPKTITLSELRSLTAHYDPLLQHIQKTSPSSSKKQQGAPSTPTDLPSLDTLRHTTIPAAVAKRSEDGSVVDLTLLELRQLVDWKLTRGKSRPTLRALVASNTTSLVTHVTNSACKLLLSPPAPDPVPTEILLKALDTLCTLRGVGPATASLIASVIRPDEVPFFSDEIYSWATGKPAKGLKYNRKEYEEVVRAVEGVRGRVGEGGKVAAEEVERAAFVAEKIKAGVGYEGVCVEVEGDGVVNGEKAGKEKEMEEKEETAGGKKSRRGVKRKENEEKIAKPTVSRKKPKKS